MREGYFFDQEYIYIHLCLLQVDFTDWSPTDPAGNGNCARMKTDPSQLGMWRDTGCNNEYAYICKKPKSK